MSNGPQGIVRAIFRSPAEQPETYERLPRIEATLEGLAGDRHSGLIVRLKRREGSYLAGSEVRNTRQISLISCEELQEIASDLSLPMISPEIMKSNLLIEGIPDLSLLPPGTRLVFASGAGLVINGTNAPCMSTGQRVQSAFPDQDGLAARFVKTAHLRRGAVAWVERAGEINEGDAVEVFPPKQPAWPAAD
ncbi:MAG TPA: MOSC domain-containing protein [Anaerolineaceae bacterium]|nr:MOSC domain-containing protein [Anaerolineaceae bacterium]